METVSREFHGNTLSIETSRVAKQANGAVMVRSGDSVVLVTACMGDERDVDFLPLSCDYVEKFYAAGRIPGGFFKREGRLGEKELLTSRLIDRPCRPLFPKGLNRELQIIATVVSADEKADTDVLALCGASAALTISDIPFDGPIAGVRVGRVNGQHVINPTPAQLAKSDLDLIVAGSRDAIVMVEGGADQVPDDEVLEALFFAHHELQAVIDMQLELQKKVGREKIEVQPPEFDDDFFGKVKAAAGDTLLAAATVADKLERKVAIKTVKETVVAQLVPEDAENADELKSKVSNYFGELVSQTIRGLLFESGKRIDGRDTKTVRDIDIEVDYLPRTHGSCLFQRGETQAIVVTTLATEQDVQRIDDMLNEESRYFMLHYNFPPFCVGEARMMRGPGRREIGHGALARRALESVLPNNTEFPYVIRIVSEITESNGSSSMASVCGGSLSMMDAGVPIKAPVAGVAMGLLKEGDDYKVLTDILGDEDHLGDMDFKICGTDKGVTAVQMDIKIKGLSREIMNDALVQAREARLHILGKMNAVLDKAAEMSDHAPRIVTLKINPDKIRDIIGPGGKTIRSITESTGVKIDVSDDGTVNVASSEPDGLQAALKIIESLTAVPEVGKIYNGVVKRIADYGAFVEILPGTDGLLHISQIADHKVDSVTDYMTEGDQVKVKVLEVDRQGKIRLSRKDALADEGEGAAA